MRYDVIRKTEKKKPFVDFFHTLMIIAKQDNGRGDLSEIILVTEMDENMENVIVYDTTSDLIFCYPYQDGYSLIEKIVSEWQFYLGEYEVSQCSIQMTIQELSE